MTEKKTRSGQALRKQAEEIARETEAQSKENMDALSPEEIRRALHELRLHQIELEMQNEDLLRTQTELDAARARYFDLYDLAPVGYCTISEKGLILEANLTAAALLGVARAALVKQPITRWILKEDQDIFYQYRKRLFDSHSASSVQVGEPQMCELRMVKKDGTESWVRMEASTVQDEDGKTVFRIVMSDITARKRVENALFENEKKLSSILDNTQDTVWSLSFPDFNILYLSPATEKLYGRTRRDFIENANLWQEVTHPDDKHVNDQALEQLQKEGAATRECRIIMPDGSIKWIYDKSWLIFDQNHTPVGVDGISSDISERKQAEEALRKSEKKFRIIVENANDIIYSFTTDGVFTYVSPGITKMLGYDVSEVENHPFQPFVHPEDLPGCLEFIERVVTTGKNQSDIELRIRHKDGNWQWHTGNASPVSDAGGNVVSCVAISRDITDRKNAEKALQESEERLREVLENSLDASYKRNLQTNDYDYLSPVFARISGYTPEEMKTLPAETVMSFVHPDDRSEVEHVIATSMKGLTGASYQLEYRFKHKDGQYRWFQDKFTVLRDAGGHALARIGSVRDITMRKHAEEALRNAHWQLESIIGATNVGTWIWNVQTGETVFDELWANIIGYTLAELAPVSIKTWERYTHPDDLMHSAGLLARHFANELPNYDCECRMKHRDGHLVWVHDRGRVITRTGDGKPLLMFGTHTDISERKQADAYREMSRDILQILNEEGDIQDTLQRVLAEMKAGIGIDAVGIRLQDGDDFPYFVQKGFPEDFLLMENTLIERTGEGLVCRDKDGNVSLECTCGLIIAGKTDPANPLFTMGGSCWTNGSSPLLDIPANEDPRLHPRNRCIHQGYASMALVPIRNNDGIVGLIQLNDRRKGRFTLEKVEIMEGIGMNIGSALLRKRAEENLRSSHSLLDAAMESTADGILVVNVNGRIVRYNKKFADLWQVPGELLGTEVDDNPVLSHVVRQMAKPETFLEKVQELYAHPEASSFDTLNLADRRVFERYSQPQGIGSEIVGRVWSFRDVTDKKIMEEELLKSRNSLQIQVALRTAELAQKNRSLALEIEDRKGIEVDLRKREVELADFSHQMEETNAALRVLLQRREMDQKEMEKRITSNIQKLIFPHLEGLRNHKLTEPQESYLNLVETSLRQVAAPFLQNLAARFAGFTSREIQIAHMIREGKSSKEIANHFNTDFRGAI